MMSSPGPSRSVATPPWAEAMKLACVWHTPLGRPVVPEV